MHSPLGSPHPPTAPGAMVSASDMALSMSMYNISEHDVNSENEFSNADIGIGIHANQIPEDIFEEQQRKVAEWDVICFCDEKMESTPVDVILRKLKEKKHGETPQLDATTKVSGNKTKGEALQASKARKDSKIHTTVSCFVCNHTLSRDMHCHYCKNSGKQHPRCFVICFGCLWHQVRWSCSCVHFCFMTRF